VLHLAAYHVSSAAIIARLLAVGGQGLLDAKDSSGKIARYREGYATRTGDAYAFQPCVMSTSGRMHGEFLRLLIIAHRRTERWFKQSRWGTTTTARTLSSFAGVSTSRLAHSRCHWSRCCPCGRPAREGGRSL
jgi:hypothetical protein